MLEIMKSIDSLHKVLSFEAGDWIFVTHTLGTTARNYAAVERQPDGGNRVIFKSSVVASVEKLHNNLQTVENMFFVRTAKKLPLIDTRVLRSARIKEALIYAKLPPITIQKSIDYAVLYEGDLVIDQHLEDGTGCWIIRESDKQVFLDKLPVLQPTGVNASVWIYSVGWQRIAGRYAFAVVYHDPTQEPPPEFFDPTVDKLSQENPQIVRIDYDTGNNKVQLIFNQTTGQPLERFVFSQDGKHAVLSQSLPKSLRNS